MPSESRRVVLTSGEVHPVTVHADPNLWTWWAGDSRVPPTDSPDTAVLAHAVAQGWKVSEVRLPGEATRAELRTAHGDAGDALALADGHIARLREEVTRLTDALAAMTAEHAAALATARREGAEGMRRGHAHHIEDVAVEADDVSRAWLLRCADEIRSGRIRALPLDAPGGGS